MRTFGLFINNGNQELIKKVVASDIYEAQQIFCKLKNLPLYDLLIIYYIIEI
jgi:hypothetical protein